MIKKIKGVSVLSLIFSVALCVSGCSAAAEAGGGTETEAPVSVDDVKVSDSVSVYKDDDDCSVVTMYLTVSQGNGADNTNHTWTDLNAYSVYYYEEKGIYRYKVEGILQVGDENGPVQGQFGYGEFAPNCIVQIRGATSTRSPQKSYKIEINKNEGYWRGQRTIALNKHVYDSVRFRNKMSYDLLKTIPGAFSARTQFVRLYVKDLTEGDKNAQFEDYGLYTQVEQINKTYLRNHGLDEFGQLYKATMFEFLNYDAIKLSDDPSFDREAFESILEIKGNEDHSKLIAMLADLNNYGIPIEEILDKYFDEENYYTWLAFQMLTGNGDTTSQNFYLYSPQNGNKWYFISWDNDDAWNYEEDIAYGGDTDGYRYTKGVSNYWGSTLHQRVLKSEECRKKLDDKINELRQLITKERLTEMVEKYASVAEPFIASVPDAMYAPHTVDEFRSILQMIPNEIEHNYEMYKISLDSPMPFYVAEPVFTGDKTMFTWDPSFDFDGESVTYKFELASDYLFNSVISVQENLSVTQAFTERLAPGQYFIRLTSRNESGMTQTAMEIYQGADDVKRYGIIGFNVLEDGTVQFGI